MRLGILDFLRSYFLVCNECVLPVYGGLEVHEKFHCHRCACQHFGAGLNQLGGFFQLAWDVWNSLLCDRITCVILCKNKYLKLAIRRKESLRADFLPETKAGLLFLFSFGRWPCEPFNRAAGSLDFPLCAFGESHRLHCNGLTD